MPHGSTAPPPPTAPEPPRRRTRLVVTAAVALVAAATVAGVLTHRTWTPPAPDSPEEAAEAFVTAGLRHDWRAQWELMCRSEQLDRGPFDRYASVQETALAVIGRPDDQGVTVAVGEAQPYPYVDLEAHLVEVWLTRAGETHEVHLVVVEEEDGLRFCGLR